ncbi:MAG: hypothetical protein J0H59_12805 [Comamonadaceae bacterium]|nr:hypothetical protein [Comamonadaceae bacterium]
MLHVITNTQDTIAGFILQGLVDKSENRIIEFPRGRRTPWQKMIRHIESLQKKTSKSHYLPQDFQQQIASIKKEDTVLFFDLDYHRDLKIIKKHLPPHKKTCLFLWNSIFQHDSKSSAAKKATLFRDLFTETCTFDPQDAETYGFRLIPQPYRFLEAPVATERENDLYFIGADKGRLAQLQKIKAMAEAANLKCRFHITPNKKIKYTPQQAALLSTHSLAYTDNIEIGKKSRCLLEIIQKNQTGATMRAIESMFLNCKLITNNPYAQTMPGYSPDRVLMLDDATPEALKAFLNGPHAAPPASALAQHEINHWIKIFHA